MFSVLWTVLCLPSVRGSESWWRNWWWDRAAWWRPLWGLSYPVWHHLLLLCDHYPLGHHPGFVAITNIIFYKLFKTFVTMYTYVARCCFCSINTLGTFDQRVWKFFHARYASLLFVLYEIKHVLQTIVNTLVIISYIKKCVVLQVWSLMPLESWEINLNKSRRI